MTPPAFTKEGKQLKGLISATTLPETLPDVRLLVHRGSSVERVLYEMFCADAWTPYEPDGTGAQECRVVSASHTDKGAEFVLRRRPKT